MDESRDETSSSGSDGWDSDEEDEKVIKYQPLAQDPVENGDSLDVSSDDDDGDEV